MTLSPRAASTTDPPYLDDLVVGEALAPAPAFTFDEGVGSLYQAISGDCLPAALSKPLFAALSGGKQRLVNPGLVLQVAIGQSTVATRRVIANLFYSNVWLLRPLLVGDTLTTTVTPEAIRLAAKGNRGKALLRIESVDQNARLIATMRRCALLPARSRDAVIEQGDLGKPRPTPLSSAARLVPRGWSTDALVGSAETRWQVGEARVDPMRDTVTGATEFVRLTQNQAIAHRDPAFGRDGQPIVYGGHTVALAQASLTRMTRELVLVVGWQACDHHLPVFEKDVLRFELNCTDALDVETGRILQHEVRVFATRSTDPEAAEQHVLTWTPISWVAQ